MQYSEVRNHLVVGKAFQYDKVDLENIHHIAFLLSTEPDLTPIPCLYPIALKKLGSTELSSFLQTLTKHDIDALFTLSSSHLCTIGVVYSRKHSSNAYTISNDELQTLNSIREKIAPVNGSSIKHVCEQLLKECMAITQVSKA